MVFSSRPWFSVRAGFDRAPFIFIHCKSSVTVLESAPFTYAARSRRTASVNFSASVRASLQVLGA